MFKQERITSREQEAADIRDATNGLEALLRAAPRHAVNGAAATVRFPAIEFGAALVDMPIDNGPATPRNTSAAQKVREREEAIDWHAEAVHGRRAYGRFQITDLSATTCHFPNGDGPFRFCGRPVRDRRPYCTPCASRAYR